MRRRRYGAERGLTGARPGTVGERPVADRSRRLVRVRVGADVDHWGKSMRGRLRLRSLALTVGCAAVLMLLSSGAASATSCPTASLTIAGVGSMLQSSMQTAKWGPAYRSLCETATVSYEARGSAEGLRAWGAEAFRRREFVKESGRDFIATDDPLELEQIRHIRENAAGVEPIVAPVAQLAVAVIAHPPRECTISRIGNSALEKVFRGAVEDIRWEAIGTGFGCIGVSIQRVVRSDTAPTTYQFKHYLYLIHREAVFEGRTWLELQSSSTTWPRGSGLAVRAARASGDASVVTEVRETSGSIAYVNLAEADGREGITLLNVENESGTAVSPRTATREANCEATVYRNELGTGSVVEFPESDIDWRAVYGSEPRIGRTTASAYPICMLTWDVVLESYATAGFANSEELETGVHAYLDYIRESTGERQIAGIDDDELSEGFRGGLSAHPATVTWANSEFTSRTIRFRNTNWFYAITITGTTLEAGYSLTTTTCTVNTVIVIRGGACEVVITPTSGTSPSGYYLITGSGGSGYVRLERI